MGGIKYGAGYRGGSNRKTAKEVGEENQSITATLVKSEKEETYNCGPRLRAMEQYKYFGIDGFNFVINDVNKKEGVETFTETIVKEWAKEFMTPEDIEEIVIEPIKKPLEKRCDDDAR